MLSGSGAVSTVATIHTVVVTSVVVSTFLANSTVAEPVKNVGRPISAFHNPSEFNAKVKNRAVIIDEISLHALMRHQYQRSRYTLPVPAPTSSTACQPERIEANCAET